MRALFVSMAVLTGCGGLEDINQPPDPNILPPTGTVPVKDCSNYTYNGNTYDCSTVDRCDFQNNVAAIAACCDCDPAMCNPITAEECPEVEPPPPPPPEAVEDGGSCMACHNGSQLNDYAGTGISNPHWVDNLAAQYLRCVDCHGGNEDGLGKDDSHVPRPPVLGDDAALALNPEAYFNYLTRQGLDKLADYTVNGKTYTATDFIQFVNPGDVRAVGQGRSCGNTGCHAGEHAEWFTMSPIFTEKGFYSNSFFTIGEPPGIPAYDDYYAGTASSWGFRQVIDPAWTYSPDIADIGKIGQINEVPEYGEWYNTAGFYNNPAVNANTIANERYAANGGGNFVNQVIPGSNLAKVVYEGIIFQCGDCHAGASGANNRYGDFRSSGCTTCHMAYSLDGRSLSTDPNVPKYEPANPDAIAAPERPHIKSHTILNVAKYINTPNGYVFVSGVNDNTCVGCHQGSNRTVLQFWGIRLDQNQDLVNNFQYPANPNTFANTAQDVRLFDPAIQNATFNGRNANQYILEEDYDADNRDDTPPDIHYERGLACIDCHSSRDMHNGTKWKDPVAADYVVDDPGMFSKMDQVVGTECQSCHGDSEYYADYGDCEDYLGNTAQCALDRFGNPIRNVTRDGNGDFWLTSRLDQIRHFIPQTLDTIVDSNKRHPINNLAIYSPSASYAMGRANNFGNAIDGVGPMQNNPNLYQYDFSHMDNVECDACHASWSNNCVGCHMQVQYNANPANFFFSNQTGKRIVTQVTNADFTYITPVWRGIEVGSRGKIGSSQPGMKAFWRYVDLNGNTAAGITFTDYNGLGNVPNFNGTAQFPALSHNRIYAHSIRGRQDVSNEGGASCQACHLDQGMIDNFGAQYQAYYDNVVVNEDYNFFFNNNIDTEMIQFIGQNTLNQLGHPYYVAMNAGLGTGMLLFDANGCPVNRIDANANRQFCQNVAPVDQFDPNNIAYALDRVVEYTGPTNASFTKPLLNPIQGGLLRSGGQNTALSGPLGATLLGKLANYDPNQGGLILDSWFDGANNAPQGGAANFVQFNY